MNELADKFMHIMGNQPLSLALVVMNLLLLWFQFKAAKSYEQSRKQTVELIVAWQKESQAIMADCVSKENLQAILGALERDRETYRAMLPKFKDEPSQ